MMGHATPSQANSLLLPKISLEENKQASVEIFLKPAGYLECAMQHVLPRMLPEKRCCSVRTNTMQCNKCANIWTKTQISPIARLAHITLT
ncbi:hypothetical protein BRADI_1g34441v3 [Brachypodium distachyon]|uniref:Uncharacterized protein n=1 Tax=Brachypodium distachyon TaxID=15368 RepID=A0A0Q3H3J4_BRADI|nr:hypothetical protein BRADI_1g34441v3 [Brachypodium distachyon]